MLNPQFILLQGHQHITEFRETFAAMDGIMADHEMRVLVGGDADVFRSNDVAEIQRIMASITGNIIDE